MMNAKKQSRTAILSMIGFIALWAVVTDAWNYSGILFPGEFPDTGKYLYGYFNRLIWMLPAFILIHKFDKNLFWGTKQLFSKPKSEPVFIVFMVLTTVYSFALMAINYHSWHVTSENIFLLTVKFLIVGFGEETVFRGWGYNLLKKVHSNTVSLLLSSLMFVVLHWPAYFIRLFLYGQFDWTGFAAQSLSVFFCGLLFAVMLKRSGSLWNPVIAHFYYDWMLEVFS